MITAIREVRRAQGMTLEEVGRACVPPTTAQTIGRLETGTRTVSVAWLNRIAAALGVEAADLVALPQRSALPVAAILDAGGARAPRKPETLAAPISPPGTLGLRVAAGVGDYRAGDVLWLEPLPPERFEQALHHHVLAPQPPGHFAFGRLVAVEPPTLLGLAVGAQPLVVNPAPVWIARAVRLVRDL